MSAKQELVQLFFFGGGVTAKGRGLWETAFQAEGEVCAEAWQTERARVRRDPPGSSAWLELAQSSVRSVERGQRLVTKGFAHDEVG